MQHKVVDLNLASTITAGDLKATFEDANPEFVEVYDKNNHLYSMTIRKSMMKLH